MLGCRFCTLDLHGKPSLRSWTRLSATAANGTSALWLVEPVDWDIGSQIVVAPTSWTKEEAERVTVAAVLDGGYHVRLAVPLAFTHLGESRFVQGESYDLRAEVGLLSRTVKVQGDDTSDGSQYGATIMMHSEGHESLTARLENLEVHRAGQAFRLGRYPIHFHMIGAVKGSYARACSVWRTFNRAFTIHGVHHLRVGPGNVAYDTMGNTYFIEDAIETKNIIEGNLAVLTKASNALLSTDQTPASFWITNPDNIVRNNAAAGSANYGFWYKPERVVTGASAGTPQAAGVCPQGTPLGEFSGNVAHSNGRYGLRLYDNEDGCLQARPPCPPPF